MVITFHSKALLLNDEYLDFAGMLVNDKCALFLQIGTFYKLAQLYGVSHVAYFARMDFDLIMNLLVDDPLRELVKKFVTGQWKEMKRQKKGSYFLATSSSSGKKTESERLIETRVTTN